MAYELLVILTGIAVGLIRRGSLWSITNLRVRYLWILPIAYLLQHFSIYHMHGSLYEVSIVVSYIGLILFCLWNVRIPGLGWALFGTIANFVVMLVNGLRMPAYLPFVLKTAPAIVSKLEHGEYGKSIAMGPHSHLNFLGDIFPFRIWPQSMISVGDIMFGVGFVIIIQYGMTLQRRGHGNDKQPSGEGSIATR